MEQERDRNIKIQFNDE